MRSREFTHRYLATLLILATVFFGALGTWALVERSAIPWHLDGAVTDIDVRVVKHPGVDDAWYVAVDGKARHWDSALARTLQVGDRVSTNRWDRTMRVNGDPTRLRLSKDARSMFFLFPIVSVTALALAWPQRRSRPVVVRRRGAAHHARGRGTPASGDRRTRSGRDDQPGRRGPERARGQRRRPARGALGGSEHRLTHPR